MPASEEELLADCDKKNKSKAESSFLQLEKLIKLGKYYTSGALLYLFTTEICEISFTTVTVSMRN